jgi:flagellar export protein FliJ
VSDESVRSLATLAELKALDERSAAERLGAARERLDRERLKLTTVQGYLLDYAGGGFSTPTRLLADRQRFRLELERSLEAQSAAVERARALAEAARAHWSGIRAEREAMQKLVERREAAATRLSLQADQRQSDEQALQQAARTEGPNG